MKIVIVGGGTAGWLAALILSSVHKGTHEFLVVSSSEYPTIGVGESSTGLLRGVVNNEVYDYGCNEYEFMQYAQATPKLGIFYKNWHSKGDYFEPLNAWCKPSYIDSDPLLISYVAQGVDPSLSSIHGRLFWNNMSGFYRKNGIVHSYPVHAYNFDSGLAGKYFKKIAINNGVTYSDLVIDDVVLGKNKEISYLLTKENKKIYGDFFVDATGFSRILSKKLNVYFIEDKDFLLDSALIFNSKSNEKIPATTSTALKYGWSWTIPKTESNGTGYVYSSKYIDENRAHKEINDFYKKEVDVIKSIKFKSGSLESFWAKNCIFIGVGSQFFEPLEATSIHGTIAQINLFAYNYLKENIKDTLCEISTKKYNSSIHSMVEQFKYLILLHYITDKKDSKFWVEMSKNAKSNEFLSGLIKKSKKQLLNLNDYDYNVYGGVSIETYNQVFSFTGNYSVEAAKKEYSQPYNKKFARITEEILCKEIEERDWISTDNFIDFIKGNK